MFERLYLDNAATSFPKPPGVLEAMREYAERLGASAGRGAYREAVETGRILDDCRRRLGRLINAEKPEQIIFTHNGSGALNQAIKGLLRRGDHVITTTMEHNSVLRPLAGLADAEMITVTHVRADSATGLVNPDDLFRAVQPNTRLLAVVHGSNVTGAVQPIDEMGAEARKRGLPLLVDAAQTAGHRAIDVQALSVDMLAMPGHKGLLGPLGTGALYLRSGFERRLTPLIEGGTGSVSEQPRQPDFLPDKFESGSHNALGLAGLAAALAWIEKRGVDALEAHDRALGERFLAGAAPIEGLRVFGPTEPRRRVAVFSVSMAGLEPTELSALMESEFGILTRSGLHCAPLAHRTIGTYDSGGTTRLSFGAFNTADDVDRCVHCLTRLANIGAEA